MSQITSAASDLYLTDLKRLIPSTGDAVTPNALGSINIVGGDNCTATGDLATHTITIDVDPDFTSVQTITFDTTGELQTGTTAGDTLSLQAYDVDGAVYKSFATLTANNTPTMNLDTDVTINNAYIYRTGGTDVPVTDGGTGRSTLTNHGVLLGAGTSGINAVAVGTTGQTLMAATGSDPIWSGSPSFSGSVTAGTGLTVTSLNAAGVVHNNASGVFSTSKIVNDDVDAAAAIVDTKLATISTAGKVSNSATTATNANTASAIVARDASGNFSAGTITSATGVSVTSGNVSLTAGNLALPTTGATVGQVTINATPVLHSMNGVSNIFVGHSSGNLTTTGTYNTGVGYNTLNAITSGQYNVAVGHTALNAATTTKYNVAIGFNSLGSLSTGDTFNTAIGYSSGVSLTSGTHNICLGRGTLASGNGSYNVIVGFLGGNNLTGTESSNILISNDGLASESNTMRLGTYGSGSNQINRTYISGVVHKPNQPAVLVYKSASTANVTGDGTGYVIAFNSEVYDQNADFNTSTYTYTAPTTGRFLVNIKVRLYNIGTQTSAYLLFSTSNRTYAYYSYCSPSAIKNDASEAVLQGSQVVDMDASDTLTASVNVSGGTKTVGVYGYDSSIITTNMDITMLC